MSLLGPLRASSSRLPLSTIAGSAGIHTTAYRAATAAQQKEAKKPGWTVQDVDEQLGKMQKQQEQMKKSGQHFDFYSINVPVLGESYLLSSVRGGGEHLVWDSQTFPACQMDGDLAEGGG